MSLSVPVVNLLSGGAGAGIGFILSRLQRPSFKWFGLGCRQAPLKQVLPPVPHPSSGLILKAADGLTGLPGRTAMEHAFQALRGPIGPLATEPLLIYLIADCDQFSKLTTTYGSAVGDAIVRAVGERVQRATAVTKGAQCFHTGADEFVILLRATAVAELEDQARALFQHCELIADELGIDTISVSVGGACARIDDLDALERLPSQVVAALRRAKQPGALGFAVHSPQQDISVFAGFNARATCAVTDSIASVRPPLLVYQPIVEARTGTTTYFEVLSRIKTRAGISLPPASFLPVIGFHRLDLEFDLALLRAVDTALCEELSDYLPRGCGLAINVSVAGLQSPAILAKLLELQQKHQATPFILEVSEMAIISNVSQVAQGLRRLQEQGIRVALDDFGTGFCNLGCLHELPADILKFDKSLTHGLGSKGGKVTEALALAAISSNFSLVAEGVETEAQARLAIEAGFSHLQGYFFGRPAAIPVVAAVSSLAFY